MIRCSKLIHTKGEMLQTMKTKLILLLVIISITLSACSSEKKIDITSKNLINKDLSDDISINKCLYNEESNAVYVKFYSISHGNDEAIILLDDNSIFYSSVYSTIEKDDYDKIIEYGDYTLMMYEIASDNDNWVEVTLSE